MDRMRDDTGSRVGDDLVEAFQEMATYLRGEVECERYEISDDVLTPTRVQAIRRTAARSIKGFERQFRIPARTMEAHEHGRRRPHAAMQACCGSSSESLTPCVPGLA